MLFVAGSCLCFVEHFLVYFFLLEVISMFSLDNPNAATLPPVDVDALVALDIDGLEPVTVDFLVFFTFSGFGGGRIGHLAGVEL